jgi:hypothetical protein
MSGAPIDDMCLAELVEANGNPEAAAYFRGYVAPAVSFDHEFEMCDYEHDLYVMWELLSKAAREKFLAHHDRQSDFNGVPS